ncbi:MAG: hypothetical protein IJZ44_02015 [Lachnospiraceae bacterium]|nr:hypothetical protein [Lachnospiraceae bacterium]
MTQTALIKRNNLAAIILSILLSYLTYLVVINQLPQILSDYNGHLYVYLPEFSESWLKGWQTVPYCMWHLVVLGFHHILHVPLADSAAWSSCVFSLFSFFVFYWMILKYTASVGKEEHPTKAAFVAFGLCVIQSLYIHWLDAGDRFLGPYSMNPIHNPTQMCVRPFALICFCLVYDIWNKQQNNDYSGVFFNMKQGLKKPFVYLSVTLFLSTLAKPTFAEMFIPAVGILMLTEWIRRMVRKDGSASLYFNNCLHMFLCAVPALLYIALQFADYFILGGSYVGEESVIITKWLEVWSMFTENVVLSIAIGMTLPLFMILINARFYLENNLGKLALVGYVVGFLEAASLGESGIKLSHGNFIWPMISGMLLMWTASSLHLLTLERTQTNTRGKQILIDIAWFLFCFHVLFGILYMKSLMTI